MGQFIYKAVDQLGSDIKGTIEAPDRKSAIAGLAENGSFVTELIEKTPGRGSTEQSSPDLSGLKELNLGRLLRFTSQKITSKDILAITNQLSTALRAGLDLLSALRIIRDQQHKTAVRDMLDKIAGEVSSGESLSDAMSKYSRIFSPLYLSMIRVGETGGILDKTMTQLVLMLQRENKIKTSMKNASAYPIFVLSIGLISVIVIITWILPKMLVAISGGIAVLPWPTKVLLALSDFLKAYGWLVIILTVAAVYYFKKWSRTTTGKLKWDAFKLKVPVLGPVVRSIAVGRFARTLGSLTKGGVTILESLGIVRDTLGNELLGKEIDGVAEKVKSGSSLATPLGASGYFPPLLVQIVAVGEQTGQLDELLLNAAETFDEQADSSIARFIAIFPAILILLLALIIVFIVVASLLPILAMELSSGVM